MESQYLPRSRDPASGFLATANADPIGETRDGDALNGPIVNGHRRYLAGYYDPGYRVGRITRRIQSAAAGGHAITLDDLAAIQADTHSNYGERMRPHLLAALAALQEELAQPGTHADLQSFAAGLTAVQKQRFEQARMLLDAWTLETPPAVGSASQQ